MLTDQHIATVKATAPLVARHAEAITRCFYERMFEGNPEVKRFFNMAHQHGGTQQRALAGAICAYAANIDNLSQLGGAVELIAQKHASLGIQPEHYPIVGRHLLDAIREVLGDAATDPVLGAWAHAYQALADIFIQREREIYASHSKPTGGWTGRRRFIVDRKTAESEIITSFYLKPNDGRPLPAFKPGQYITVHLDHPTVPTSPRNYSLSDRPGLDYYRISVKREPAPPHAEDAPHGLVSNHLHDHVQPGDAIHLGPPCGDFFLRSSGVRPIVLLSGGVGITPMMAMLRELAHEGPSVPVWFIHAARHGRVHAMREQVRNIQDSHEHIHATFVYDDPTDDDIAHNRCDRTGFISGELLQELLPGTDCDFYFCGPKPFMTAVYRNLKAWDVPDEQVHFEFFGPREEMDN